MKTFLTIILFFKFCLGASFAQDATNTFASEVFKNKYKRQHYQIFPGPVKRIDENTFGYAGSVLAVSAEKKSLIAIFARGILHPFIIFGKQIRGTLSASPTDTMPISAQVLGSMTRNDEFRIENLEELEKLNPDSKTKRFMFWLYTVEMFNPTEYYFELYNEKGTKTMSLNDFIKGSKLTFFYKGTIII